MDITEPINITLTKGAVTTNSINVVASATDNESGIKGYEFRINGGDWVTNNYSNTYTFTNLSSGTYRIETKVYNNVGLSNISNTITVSTLSLDSPLFDVYSEVDSPNKIVTINYPNVVLKQYSLDGGNTWIDYTEPIKFTQNGSILAKASDGNNVITSSISIFIDLVQPNDIKFSFDNSFSKSKSIVLSLTDTGGSGLSSGILQYAWSLSNVNEPTDEEYVTIEYEPSDDKNQKNILINANDLDGQYYLWVKPVKYSDNAGNRNDKTVISSNAYKFDNTAPVITVDVDYDNNAVVKISDEKGSGLEGGIYKIYYGIGTKGANSCDMMTSNIDIEVADGATSAISDRIKINDINSEHRIYVCNKNTDIKDIAGNVLNANTRISSRINNLSSISLESIESDRDNNIKINYNIDNFNSSLSLTCEYGMSPNNYDNTSTSITTSNCTLSNVLQGKDYYYRICITNTNDESKCINGNVSSTYNQTAAFFGDSITYGLKSTPIGYSWANYIADNYDLAGTENFGEPGWRISNLLDENNERLFLRDKLVENKNSNYDYIILHGGCNDIAAYSGLKTVDEILNEASFNENDFSGNYNDETFIGGLETYIYNAVKQWPNARIGYIIPYASPNRYNRRNNKSRPYYNAMKKVLEKWNIQYIDLFSGISSNNVSYSELLKVETRDYLVDDLHLNRDGYNLVSPYIYSWMHTIPRYSYVTPPTLNVTSTKDKTAIFFGDSITEGIGSNPPGYSWANYIGDNYDLLSIKNAGKAGYRISRYTVSDSEEEKYIKDIVIQNNDENYDYVILHGGCNDVSALTPMGNLDLNDFSGNYDENTFVGGLESYIYQVKKQWPNAKIGYIIPYSTPNYPKKNDKRSSPYYLKMKEVLEKWNIGYIDLFFGGPNNIVTFSNILSVSNSKYMKNDNVHIDNNGYELISPYIYRWMQTIN